MRLFILTALSILLFTNCKQKPSSTEAKTSTELPIGLTEYDACNVMNSDSLITLIAEDLPFELTFPHDWNYQTSFTNTQNVIVASITFVDSTEVNIVDELFMIVAIDTASQISLAQYVLATKHNFENAQMTVLDFGKGSMFGRPCTYLTYLDQGELFLSKSLQLYFMSDKGNNILCYEYNAKNDVSWFDNICYMLSINQF